MLCNAFYSIVLFKPKSNGVALIAIVPPSAQSLKRQQATAHPEPPNIVRRATSTALCPFLSRLVLFCLVLSCYLRSPHRHRRENNARCSNFLYFTLLCSIFLYFSLFIHIAIVRISLTLYVLLLLPVCITTTAIIILLLLLLLLLLYYAITISCYYYITIIIILLYYMYYIYPFCIIALCLLLTYIVYIIVLL